MADQPMQLENDPYASESPYDVLGVDRDDDRSKIKSAYRAIQKRARRGDELWTKAQVANEGLTKPKKRLLVDLFIVLERRAWDEIVRRYGDLSFEIVPSNLAPLLLRATDVEWGTVTDDFAQPAVPKVTFVRTIPGPPDADEDVVRFGLRT